MYVHTLMSLLKALGDEIFIKAEGKFLAKIQIESTKINFPVVPHLDYTN
jgi:hypothetical protein